MRQRTEGRCGVRRAVQVEHVRPWSEPGLYRTGKCRFANTRGANHHRSVQSWFAKRFNNRFLEILPDQRRPFSTFCRSQGLSLRWGPP
jgi:hypothetical protein